MTDFNINLAFSFVVALFTCIVLIPPLMRVSVKMHLVDVPDERKPHEEVTPRSGGIAIALGVFLPIMMWMQFEPKILSFVLSGLIIVVLGVLDDRWTLSYRWKFLGQLVAIAVVIKGGVVVWHIPFLGFEPIPPLISYPLTAICLLAITNAINLSDGLDGLAGGITMICTAVIGLLAWQADGYGITMISLAVIGAIFGFLRYNTHPAIIFMGDAGSQFLGFTIGVLVIMLTQDVHTALSPALPLLLFGVPILDTVTVMIRRLRDGHSPFMPDNNHFHHRLMAMGFRHHEVVSIFYVAQAILVCSAMLFRYESDWVLMLVYIAFSIIVLGLFYYASRSGWQLRAHVPDGSFVERRNPWVRKYSGIGLHCVPILEIGVALLLIGSMLLSDIRIEGIVYSLIIVPVIVYAASRLPDNAKDICLRIMIYMACVYAIYVFVSSDFTEGAIGWLVDAWLVFLAIVLVITLRMTRHAYFRITPQDILVIFVALIIPSLPADMLHSYKLGEITIRVLVLLYVSEFLFNNSKNEKHLMKYAALICLTLAGVQSLIG